MQTNLPVWGYYPKDDSYFIDPMYAPYMRELVRNRRRTDLRSQPPPRSKGTLMVLSTLLW